MTSSNVDRVTAALRGLASGDADLATSSVHPDAFIQHDPSRSNGIAGLRERIGGSPLSGRLEVVRIIEDGSYVVVHGRSDADGGRVFFAVFRVENDLLVEQWLFSEAAAPANESGHTQTDGPTRPSPDGDTSTTKALVRDYYETVHLAGRRDRIDRYMSGDLQIRHEPGVCDGVLAFKQDLEVLTRSRTIDEIVLLLGQGDLVFVAARGTHEREACAYLDIYRVEADKLVEHWGFSEAVPPRERSRNSNGLL